MTAAAPLRRRPRAGPYNVPRPAVISFSGGRTSAYMLKMILDAHDGRLPEDLSIVFALCRARHNANYIWHFLMSGNSRDQADST